MGERTDEAFNGTFMSLITLRVNGRNIRSIPTR